MIVTGNRSSGEAMPRVTNNLLAQLLSIVARFLLGSIRGRPLSLLIKNVLIAGNKN